MVEKRCQTCCNFCTNFTTKLQIISFTSDETEKFLFPRNNLNRVLTIKLDHKKKNTEKEIEFRLWDHLNLASPRHDWLSDRRGSRKNTGKFRSLKEKNSNERTMGIVDGSDDCEWTRGSNTAKFSCFLEIFFNSNERASGQNRASRVFHFFHSRPSSIFNLKNMQHKMIFM